MKAATPAFSVPLSQDQQLMNAFSGRTHAHFLVIKGLPFPFSKVIKATVPSCAFKKSDENAARKKKTPAV